MLGVPCGAGAAHVMPLGPIGIEQTAEWRQHLGDACCPYPPVGPHGVLDRLMMRDDEVRKTGADACGSCNRQHGHDRLRSLPTCLACHEDLPNKSATEVTYPPQRAGMRLCSAVNTEDPSPWPPRPNHVPTEDQIQAWNRAFLGSDIVIVWSLCGPNKRY